MIWSCLIMLAVAAWLVTTLPCGGAKADPAEYQDLELATRRLQLCEVGPRTNAYNIV
jgi:hypothetical protein